MVEHVSSVLGIPVQSSYAPATANAIATDRMTPDFPHVNDIAKSSPLVLVSVDEFTDFPRPTLHNTVYIGGLGLLDSNNKPLGEPFKSEMEKGKDGVVFVSFGSNVPTRFFPRKVRENLVKAMSELPDYHFIFKVDKEDNETAMLAKDHSKHLRVQLGAPATASSSSSVAGLCNAWRIHSVIESARHGVPLLLTGFFADQERNALLVGATDGGWRSIGRVLPSHTCSSKKLFASW